MNFFQLDFVHSLRRLRKEYEFSITFILILTSVLSFTFTVMAISNHILIKPLPYPNSENMVAIETDVHLPDATMQGNSPGISRELIEKLGLFQKSAIHISGEKSFLNIDDKQIVPVSYVTPDYFDLLSFQLISGKFFSDSFIPNKREFSVIISEYFSKTNNPGKHILIGEQLLLDEENYIVVGIVEDIKTPWNFSEKPIHLWLPASNSNRNFYKIPEFGSEISILAITNEIDIKSLNGLIDNEINGVCQTSCRDHYVMHSQL